MSRSLFPAKRLPASGSGEPARVSWTGEVASDNRVTGPMTGQRAALFLLTVGVRVEVTETDTEGRSSTREVFEERARMIAGTSVLVRTAGGTVLVPAEGLDLVFPHAEGATLAVGRPLPPEIAGALDPSEQRVLFYRELALSRGDRVRLEAVVAPREAGGGPGEPDAPWVARPDLGRVTIVDRATDDLDITPIKAMSSRRAAAWLTAVFLALGAAYLWIMRMPDPGQPGADGHPPAGRQPTVLRDTEGRSFEDTCSPDTFCTLTQTGGPVDPVRPRVVLRYLGYLVSVCTAEVRQRADGQGESSWVEDRDCRPLACDARSGCPAGAGVECVNGLCAQPGKEIGLYDVHPLCLAGKGIDARSPDVEAAGARTPCRAPDCRLPPTCRAP